MKPIINSFFVAYDAWKADPLDLFAISKMATTADALRAVHLPKTHAGDERMVSICRNPYGHSNDVVRSARHAVCDTLESVRADRDELLAENTKLRAERDHLNNALEKQTVALVNALAERDALAALLNEAQGFIVPDTAWDYTTDAGGYLYDRIDAALKDKP